jgi:hypothetical protein
MNRLTVVMIEELERSGTPAAVVTFHDPSIFIEILRPVGSTH